MAANVPVSAQTALLATDGRAWWGNRAISPIPQDPSQPDELCCDEEVQIKSPQAEAAQCAVDQFFQSMVPLGGTKDFICKNPLVKKDQPGYNPIADSVDTSQPIRYEQPFFLQGLWDEEASDLLVRDRGKTSGDIIVAYFKDKEFLSESTVVKQFGVDFIITEFKLEPFVGANYWNVTFERHEDKRWMLAYDDNISDTMREIEGRRFYSNGVALGDLDNVYVMEPSSARVAVYESDGTTFLFYFGEDLSGFPPGSKYIEYEKWFNPVEIDLTSGKILVKDETWDVLITFNIDGFAEKCEPVKRRR